MSWEEDTKWESDWWGKCTNTIGEELKQFTYFDKMGYRPYESGFSPFNYNLNTGSVLDIGGGPVSILLKCAGYSSATVIDPCDYPEWVGARYALAGINFVKQKGEDIDLSKTFDLVIVYNVLQHTEDPEKIVRNALAVSKEFRIFEWIFTGIAPGHPHTFTDNQLNSWLGGRGKVDVLKGEGGCHGTCYAGIFKGKHYGK